ESLRKADVFLQRLLAHDPGRPDLLSMGAELEQDAMILADSQHHDLEALAHTQRCAEYLDKLFDGGQASPAQVKANITTFANVGWSHRTGNPREKATRYARRAVDLARTAGDTAALGQGLSALANALRFAGDLNAALPAIIEARRVADGGSYPNELMKSLL